MSAEIASLVLAPVFLKFIGVLCGFGAILAAIVQGLKDTAPRLGIVLAIGSAVFAGIMIFKITG